MRRETFWNPQKPGFDTGFTPNPIEGDAESQPLRDPSKVSQPSAESASVPRLEHASEQREAERPDGSTDDQLLGVLAEALFDRKRAGRALDSLKASPLYDPERRQWNSSGEGSGIKAGGRQRAVRTQLLGVIAEAIFDRNAAQKTLDVLKSSPFYDREHGRWNRTITDSQVVENATHSADDQLLAVLVEALFDREAAYEMLDGLKASPLYDCEHRRWNDTREGTQLLAASVESLFNRSAALATLAVLRASEPASKTVASKDYADALVLNAVGGKLFGRCARWWATA